MTTRLAVKLLKALRKPQLRKFQAFLRMEKPNDKYLDDLLEALLQYFPNYSCTPEIIHQLAAPKKAFNQGVFDNKLYDLAKLLKDFMAYLQLQDSSNRYQKLHLAAAYIGQKDKADLFFQLNKEAQKAIKNDQSRSSLYNRYQNADQRYYYKAYNRQQKGASDQLFQDMVNSLDQFYSMAVLPNAVESAHREQIRAQAAQLPLVDAVLNQAEATCIAEHPVFEAYRLLLELHHSPDLNTYEALEEIIMKNPEASDSAYFLFPKLINQTFFLYEQGFLELRTKCYKLYRLAIERGLIQQQGKYMSKAHFTNAIILASMVPKEGHQWATSMIQKANKLLKPIDLDNSIALAKAFLKFGRKDYQGSLDSLQFFQGVDIEEKLKFKILLIQCHYEMSILNPKHHIDMISLLKAYQTFLKAQKQIGDDKFEGNLNFCRILRKFLAKYRPTVTELKKEILECEQLVLRPWLLSKLDTLPDKNGRAA